MRVLTGFGLFQVLLLAQTAAAPGGVDIGKLGEYGLSTGIAGLVLYFWRMDRKDREDAKKADEERYQALAKDFRQIVQDNTVAITRLTDALTNK